MKRIGAVAIARTTFDMPFAEANAAAAFDVLTGLEDTEVITTRTVAVDDETLRLALEPLEAEQLHAVVVIQATFADSTMAAAIAEAHEAPLVLWAIPEPRRGGRLRANSFCGINLAAYVLRRSDRAYRFLIADPTDHATSAKVSAAVAGAPNDPPEPGAVSWNEHAHSTALTAAASLGDARIGVIGDRPDGFEPCDYDPKALGATTGVTVDAVPLPALFERATTASEAAVNAIQADVEQMLDGIEGVDEASLRQSLRLHLGMRGLSADRSWSGFATRCWPECFTEFGGAACSAMAMSNSDGIPGCCEADAYGAVTSLMLQSVAAAPAFVADLVDLDMDDDTGVMWHCGLAPLEMAHSGARPRATIHSNRAQPLLNEFALRPGRVTIARLSQSRNAERLVVGGGEMLDRPLPFSGTSGVIRFDDPAAVVAARIMHEGLEHHYGLVYGDVRPELHALAEILDLEVVGLS